MALGYAVDVCRGDVIPSEAFWWLFIQPVELAYALFVIPLMTFLPDWISRELQHSFAEFSKFKGAR